MSDERFDSLKIDDCVLKAQFLSDISEIKGKKPNKDELKTLESINAYREFLPNLKILDPACGSGAFLNKALECLINEHRIIENALHNFKDITLLNFTETTILEHNLYGVDINADATQIAKLSLWLKTAQKGRALTNLSDKIITANSLLDFPFDFKFDIVIGNPPYVRQESIKDIKPELSKTYSVYNGTTDLFVYFYELGIKSLKDSGLLGFICSNKFFRAKYGEGLREFILNNTQITDIADFNGVKIFADATVDSTIAILKKQNTNEQFKFYSPNLKDFSLLNQKELNKSAFNFLNPLELNLKQKIEHIGTPLKEWDININYGIKTGLNEAFIIDENTKDEILNSCLSIDEKNRTKELIKPILRGRDIKRYSYEWAGIYLINTHNGYENTPAINIDDYPALKAHLDKFEPALSKRTDKGKTPSFFFDKENFYTQNTTYMINGTNLKYICSLLNSDIVAMFFKLYYSSGGLGESVRYLKENIQNLPIPKISAEQEKEFEILVDEIIDLKSQNEKFKMHFDKLNAANKIEISEKIEQNKKRVDEISNEIDAKVFEIYGLNDDEIKLILNS